LLARIGAAGERRRRSRSRVWTGPSRSHLAGALGAEVCDRLFELWWSGVSRAGRRGLTAAGSAGLRELQTFYHRVWGPALQAAGLQGFRFGQLRHTGATMALEAGATRS
jgi:integrase